MTTKAIAGYVKVPKHKGIYRHSVTRKFQARKKIGRSLKRKTFPSLREALKWYRLFNGEESKDSSSLTGKTSTLKEVWEIKKKNHFPTLAQSTVDVWTRRYTLLKKLEHLPMSEIEPLVVSDWIDNCLKYFRSDDYNLQGRGNARRCNLNNELNLLRTIFNWYKDSEYFQKESKFTSLPVLKYHYKRGILREPAYKERAIRLDELFPFFDELKQPFKDLAMFQFFTASRISEAAGLQWNRVDFKRKRILIMETCYWDQSNKVFVKLNPHPKNKQPRAVYITDEILEILKRRKAQQLRDNSFVFHFLNKPINYGTIQVNFRSAQRKAGVSVTGTHNLRHGMATLARQVNGSLDAVIAMTGHKCLKLADHYSKIDDDKQKQVSLQIMEHIKNFKLSE